MLNPEKISHENLQLSPPHLSDAAIFQKNPKKSFQQYYSYILLIFRPTLSQTKTNVNPRTHPT